MKDNLESLNVMVRWLIVMVWVLLCSFSELKSTVAKLECASQEASDDEKQS